MERSSFLLRVVLLVALAAFAGCGQSETGSSDEQEVRQVVEAYLDALTAQDAAAACQYQLPHDNCFEATKHEIAQGVSRRDFGQVKGVTLEESIARVGFSSGALLVLSKSGDAWKVGAPADAATKVGGPDPPPVEPCTAEQAKKLRESGAAPAGQERLYCPVED